MAGPASSLDVEVIGAGEESSSGESAKLSKQAPPAADDAKHGEVPESATVDSVLEAVGFGRFQVMVMFICGMAWFVDSVEVGGMAYIYVALDATWGTTTAHWGLLQSVKSACSVAGALFFGAFADRRGRRPAFLAALTLTAAGGLASAAARSYSSLLPLRAVTNVGAGGILPVAISLLAEHLPPSVRESYMVLMHVFFVSGHVLAVVISMVLPSADGMWRIFLLALAAPAVLLLSAWRVVPESPVYLHQSGREEEAKQALEAMCRFNRHGSQKAELLLEQLHSCRAADSNQATGLLRLLASRSVAVRTLLFGLLWALTSTASDYTNWITELSHEYGFEKRSVEGFMIACKLVGVVAFFVAAACARGKRGELVLCGGYVGATAAAAAATAAASLEPDGPWLPVSVGLVFFPFDIVWSLIYAVTASKFEPLCRASALSTASGFGRGAAGLVPLATGAMLARGGELSAMCLWSGAWAAAACLSCALLCRRAKPA